MSLFILVITYLFGAIAVTSRKVPAFLQGLLQFGLRLERETGIEPATLCLGSKCSTTELLPPKAKV